MRVESDLVVPRSTGVVRLVREGGTEQRLAGISCLLLLSRPVFVVLVEVPEQSVDSGVERRLLIGLGDFSLPP